MCKSNFCYICTPALFGQIGRHQAGYIRQVTATMQFPISLLVQLGHQFSLPFVRFPAPLFLSHCLPHLLFQADIYRVSLSLPSIKVFGSDSRYSYLRPLRTSCSQSPRLQSKLVDYKQVVLLTCPPQKVIPILDDKLFSTLKPATLLLIALVLRLLHNCG